uniref:Polypeptide N-acetylgalactosaminyltransferase n=1 Tax=Plectus sambesii TaxID=2011161 RepID=A0A914W963_9BILA
MVFRPLRGRSIAIATPASVRRIVSRRRRRRIVRALRAQVEYSKRGGLSRRIRGAMICRRRRCRRKSLLLYCAGTIGFVVLWSFFTVMILVAQDQYVRSGADYDERKTTEDSYMGRGVQVVVGHYNGNLPDEKRKNLTEEQLNANNYKPVGDAGEMGKAVKLNAMEEKLADDIWSVNQFNLVASDRIAFNRSLPDVRKKACKEKSYPPPNSLPTTSVIIVYHNEAFSSLLRTVTSVINRSPKEVLKEIILVDDYSSREFLKTALDKYVATLQVPIKVIRATERVGLIRARLMGAAEAKGDVLTFLDSHCECTNGWLEPLLGRIKEDRKAVVCPVIDVINDRTFAYQKGIELFRGGFNWNLQFRWYAVPPHEIKRRSVDGTSPIASPTMAGGLFSIDRKYFEELGGYDHEMDIWGGENLEISFRIWQCGGRVEILPCSHVGHVFRKASPHDFPGKSSGKILNSNLVRVAEVWMDEWKHLFYKTAPQALQLKHSIDVSDRIEIRKQLHCKDFDWYLQNVWPEHFLPKPDSMFGRIKHLSASSSEYPCLHWAQVGGGSKRASLQKCGDNFDRTEIWIYTKEGQIKGDEHQCLSAIQVSGSQQWIVQLKECGEYENEFWDYGTYKKTMVHRQSGLCLDQPIEKAKDASDIKTPSLQKCSRGGRRQQWELLRVDWLPDDIPSNHV